MRNLIKTITIVAALAATTTSAVANASYDKHTASNNEWATGFLKNAEEGRVFDFGQFIHIKTAAGVTTIVKQHLLGKSKSQVVDHITSEVVETFSAAGPSVSLATGAAASVVSAAAEEVATAEAARIAAHNAAGSAAASEATNSVTGLNQVCNAMGCR